MGEVGLFGAIKTLYDALIDVADFFGEMWNYLPYVIQLVLCVGFGTVLVFAVLRRI